MVLSDTVGFIRELPHTLVAAFRATLEETVQADLLLHVVDATSPEHDAQIGAVNEVLAEIGAGALPQVLVLNKIDLTGLPPGVERDEYGRIARLRVSARTGAGLELVRLAIDEFRSGATLRGVVQPARLPERAFTGSDRGSARPRRGRSSMQGRSAAAALGLTRIRPNPNRLIPARHPITTPNQTLCR